MNCREDNTLHPPAQKISTFARSSSLNNRLSTSIAYMLFNFFTSETCNDLRNNTQSENISKSAKKQASRRHTRNRSSKPKSLQRNVSILSYSTFPISEEDETLDERKLPKSLHLIRHLRPLEMGIFFHLMKAHKGKLSYRRFTISDLWHHHLSITLQFSRMCNWMLIRAGT